ncbi:hypothetical protein mRhiFer1_010247 [Rhinolophus ferrumequinum]|uniref:Uncharacterized protein n=1 Tax=Rhinolophus ferrumequinum TaxID=59479 RepID=A0A7J7X5B7_RHIFE|nr:hypothetical protein mRhiFer1_010247 [Rhinolophus ferrumequinum]
MQTVVTFYLLTKLQPRWPSVIDHNNFPGPSHTPFPLTDEDLRASEVKVSQQGCGRARIQTQAGTLQSPPSRKAVQFLTIITQLAYGENEPQREESLYMAHQRIDITVQPNNLNWDKYRDLQGKLKPEHLHIWDKCTNVNL